MTDRWSLSFLDLQQRLDEMFEKLIYRRWAIPNPAEWRPALDLRESNDEYLVEIDLPGVPPDQVELRVSEREIIVRGTRPETSFEGAYVSQPERRCGPFRMSLVFSHLVAPERTQAQWRHGTYVIRLVKKHQAGQLQRDAGPEVSEIGHMIQITSE